MPGASLSSGLSMTMRTGSVRVCGSTSGSSATTRPLNASAGPRRRMRRDARSHRNHRDLRFGNLRIDPDGLESIDAKQRCARHERRTLTDRQLRNDAVDRRDQRRARVGLALRLQLTDRAFRHPSTVSRWRAASRIACPRADCASSSARYSSCASSQAGATMSASGCPRRT